MFVLLVLGFAVSHRVFTALSWKDTLTDQISRTLAALLFTSVITERAVAAFMRPLLLDHDYMSDKVEVIRRQRHLDWVLRERGSIPEKEWSAKYSQALRDLELKNLEVQRWDARMERRAVLLGLALGVLLAAFGVRALAPLLAESANGMMTPLQRPSFDVLDVLLTGAVIGGGSKGVRSVAQALLDIIAIPTRRMET